MSPDQHIYLQDLPLAQARQRFEAALHSKGLWKVLAIEDIPLDESGVGRILAEAVWAIASSPHYHAAAMDGFAVRAQDTGNASPANPVYLECPGTGGSGQALYLDTGDVLPGWADAIVPIETIEPIFLTGAHQTDPRRASAILLRAPLAPWQYIRPFGEDIVATQLILAAGQALRPVDLGAAAAAGHTRLRVSRQPRVAVIPTGSELVSTGKAPQPGEIIEFNSIVLAAQVISWGGQAQRYPPVRDDFETICSLVRSAAETNDLILINAGSSAGSEDYTAQVVSALGELLVHGIAVRPGHPVVLGMITAQDGRPIPVIGVPGFPVSAALTAEIFVEPLMALWLGRQAWEPEIVTAVMSRKVVSPAGDDDYLRVVLGIVGDRLLAAPLSRGSGAISSLVRADGICMIPAGTQGIEPGEPVAVRLYRSQAEIEHTILAIGSHDLTLDLLAQHLASHRRRLASANVGSLGGLLALRRNEAHLAGSHLLDPLSGIYNLRYIKEYLPGIPITLVALVNRQQGLLVQKGNPKKIFDLGDLTRAGVDFINRQRGAGTRVLLDYHLEKAGIPANQIKGYDREEITHLTVAAAIASGRADAGLGIAAAAQALDLDFVSLYQEPYHLVIPSRYFNSGLLAPLFEILREPGFRTQVARLPGYDISAMGDIVAEIV